MNIQAFLDYTAKKQAQDEAVAKLAGEMLGNSQQTKLAIGGAVAGLLRGGARRGFGMATRAGSRLQTAARPTGVAGPMTRGQNAMHSVGQRVKDFGGKLHGEADNLKFVSNYAKQTGGRVGLRDLAQAAPRTVAGTGLAAAGTAYGASSMLGGGGAAAAAPAYAGPQITPASAGGSGDYRQNAAWRQYERLNNPELASTHVPTKMPDTVYGFTNPMTRSYPGAMANYLGSFVNPWAVFDNSQERQMYDKSMRTRLFGSWGDPHAKALEARMDPQTHMLAQRELNRQRIEGQAEAIRRMRDPLSY